MPTRCAAPRPAECKTLMSFQAGLWACADACMESRGKGQSTGRDTAHCQNARIEHRARVLQSAGAPLDGIGCPAAGGTSLASPWPPFTCSFQLGASRNSWSKNVGEPAPGDKSAALGRAAANRAMDPPTPQRAAAAPRWLPPRHALPPGAAPLMMLPFGPPPAPGWLPMLPVVGAAPAPARGVVPGPAPAGWLRKWARGQRRFRRCCCRRSKCRALGALTSRAAACANLLPEALPCPARRC